MYNVIGILYMMYKKGCYVLEIFMNMNGVIVKIKCII